MTKSRHILVLPRRPFTEAELQVLREYYPNTRTDIIAEAMGRPSGSVHQKAAKLGLKKDREFVRAMSRAAMADPNHGGRKAQFPKGHVPANKGVKRPPGWAPGNMRATQFPKGNRPHTWVPVGSYRVNSDGYLERKENDLPGPNTVRWKPVHRLVWEEANGPTPAGHVVVFKPGRFTAQLDAITLDAVELITRAELMARNTIHRYPAPLKKAIRLVARVRKAIDEQPH